MIWLVLAAAGVAATAALGAASPRLDSAVPFALAVYLLASAELIALTEVLSLFGWIRPAGYAVGEASVSGQPDRGRQAARLARRAGRDARRSRDLRRDGLDRHALGVPLLRLRRDQPAGLGRSAVGWAGRKIFAGLHIPANPPESTQTAGSSSRRSR